MIRGLLFDLSGVLYLGDGAIDGAAESLALLRRTDLPVRFVTNVTRQPASQLINRLSRLGLDVADSELITAPRAARAYLIRHNLSPHLLIHPALESEFSDLANGPPTAVLVGDAGNDFNYANLNCAFRLLMDGAVLLAMGNNHYFQERDGLSLDIGPFVAALEYASGQSAIILGKPSPDFFKAAVESLGCAESETVMVGDDALADVDGALAAGLQGVLVKTGKYRKGDEGKITRPGAHVATDVRAAVEYILNRA